MSWSADEARCYRAGRQFPARDFAHAGHPTSAGWLRLRRHCRQALAGARCAPGCVAAGFAGARSGTVSAWIRPRQRQGPRPAAGPQESSARVCSRNAPGHQTKGRCAACCKTLMRPMFKLLDMMVSQNGCATLQQSLSFNRTPAHRRGLAFTSEQTCTPTGALIEPCKPQAKNRCRTPTP